MRNFLEETKDLLADHLGISKDVITPESTLHDLGADSLDDVEIVMALDDEYDIDINDEDAKKFRTVAAIVEYLEKNVPQ